MALVQTAKSYGWMDGWMVGWIDRPSDNSSHFGNTLIYFVWHHQQGKAVTSPVEYLKVNKIIGANKNSWPAFHVCITIGQIAMKSRTQVHVLLRVNCIRFGNP